PHGASSIAPPATRLRRRVPGAAFAAEPAEPEPVLESLPEPEPCAVFGLLSSCVTSTNAVMPPPTISTAMIARITPMPFFFGTTTDDPGSYIPDAPGTACATPPL